MFWPITQNISILGHRDLTDLPNSSYIFKVGAYGCLKKNFSIKFSQNVSVLRYFLVVPETMDNTFL